LLILLFQTEPRIPKKKKKRTFAAMSTGGVSRETFLKWKRDAEAEMKKMKKEEDHVNGEGGLE